MEYPFESIVMVMEPFDIKAPNWDRCWMWLRSSHPVQASRPQCHSEQSQLGDQTLMTERGDCVKCAAHVTSSLDPAWNGQCATKTLSRFAWLMITFLTSIKPVVNQSRRYRDVQQNLPHEKHIQENLLNTKLMCFAPLVTSLAWRLICIWYGCSACFCCFDKLSHL